MTRRDVFHLSHFKFNSTFASREIIALDSTFTVIIVLVKGQQSHVFEKNIASFTTVSSLDRAHSRSLLLAASFFLQLGFLLLAARFSFISG